MAQQRLDELLGPISPIGAGSKQDREAPQVSFSFQDGLENGLQAGVTVQSRPLRRALGERVRVLRLLLCLPLR